MRAPEDEPLRSEIDDSGIPNDDPEIVAAHAAYNETLSTRSTSPVDVDAELRYPLSIRLFTALDVPWPSTGPTFRLLAVAIVVVSCCLHCVPTFFCLVIRR
jgi:hypothetical protein